MQNCLGLKQKRKKKEEKKKVVKMKNMKEFSVNRSQEAKLRKTLQQIHVSQKTMK